MLQTVLLESVREILAATKTADDDGDDDASSCSDDYVLKDDAEIAADEAKAAAAKAAFRSGPLFKIRLLLEDGAPERMGGREAQGQGGTREGIWRTRMGH